MFFFLTTSQDYFFIRFWQSGALLCLLLVLLSSEAQAQIGNPNLGTLPKTEMPKLNTNLRIKYFNNATADTLYLDSLTILPNSLIINDLENKKILDTAFFVLKNNVLINKKKLAFAKLSVTYRVFPFDISAATVRKDSTFRGLDDIGRAAGFEYNPYNNNNAGLIDAPGLSYNGSFERGISFGNNQDLVVNSNFNLQMAGKLGDDIEILGAISDNNVPLQAEGNTQQLNEFDRLFIQIKRKNVKLTAGDYELQRPKAYFVNYYKKLQGLTFENSLELGKGKLNTTASAAISRGKFGRNTLRTQEGNQGPYKLLGNDGELFIIVLSGTEKVFLDGQLLTRGQQNDYIIDYNRGEIQFTPNRLITKDVRILVEFEYTANEYQRSLVALNLDYQTEKLRLNFNAYNEQDGKAPTLQGELTQAQQAALANIPDDIGSANVPSVDTATFRADRILYKMVDTLVNGVLFDSILVYSTSRDSAFFTAVFSEVGQGNGDYVRSQSAANGTVFRWVAPDTNTGNRNGSYAPVAKLVAPNRQQMFAVGAAYQFSKTSTLRTEVALSYRDLNRLSTVQGADNLGVGFQLGYDNRLEFGQKDSTKIKKNQLAVTANYEFVQRTFQPLNPYRLREFARDWNTSGLEKSDEHLVTAGFTLKNGLLGTLQYQLSGFLKDSIYNGLRHYAVFSARPQNWDIRLELNHLNTQNQTGSSVFFRPKFNLIKTFPKLGDWQIGIYGEREKNQLFAANKDSLAANSFYYDLLRTYLKSPETEGFQFSLNYTQRTDFVPQQQNFQPLSRADELNVRGDWKQKTFSTLQFNLTYRNLRIEPNRSTDLEPQETYLGRMEHSFNLKKGLFRTSTTYEISSGQEQKIQFNYVKVEAGQGAYTWIDRNLDSIKQIDEFELAVFQDQADHIRVATFTNEFIRTNTIQFNQSLNISPKAIWYKEKGIKKVLAKFALQSAWQTNRKVLIAPEVMAWNPFQTDIADTALVSLTSSVRHSLFFNRTDPKFGGEIGYFDNGNRIILTSGFESRGRQESFIKLRWNAHEAVNLQFGGSLGTLRNDSELFNSRDYTINFRAIEPEISYFALQRTFRATVKYRYKNSRNALADEVALNHEGKLELTYNRAAKSAYRLNFSYVKVDYTGSPNTPIEFAMLEGLKNGQNFLWNVSLNRSIARNVQLNLSYEGRKTGEARVIHVGRASVRAGF